jgi:hypothetical protein
MNKMMVNGNVTAGGGTYQAVRMRNAESRIPNPSQFHGVRLSKAELSKKLHLFSISKRQQWKPPRTQAEIAGAKGWPH